MDARTEKEGEGGQLVGSYDCVLDCLGRSAALDLVVIK